MNGALKSRGVRFRSIGRGVPLPRGSSPALRVILLGESYEISHAMQHPGVSEGSAFTVVGAVPCVDGEGGFPGQDIRQLVAAQRADAIMVTGAVSRALLTLCGELAVVLGCRLLSLAPSSRDSVLQPVLVWEGDHPFVEVAIASGRRRFDRVKRWVDLAAAAGALLLAAPVIGLAALAVRVESPGLPIFGHVRIGRGGRRFRCWKLRTMRQDAERRLQEEPALLALYHAHDFKLPDHVDPRITRVGRWLRKTSVDELPQLFNVLMGQMSFVGPRPIVAEELHYYAGEVLTLLSVRPGITGAWAVSGRHHLAYPRRSEVELAYVRDRSASGDLSILLRTVRAVLDPGFGRLRASSGSARR